MKTTNAYKKSLSQFLRQTIYALSLWHTSRQCFNSEFKFHSDTCYKLAEILHEHVFQFTRE